MIQYEELSRLVGTGSGPSGEQVAPAGMGSASGVTITWLIHDAQVWRVDRVDLSTAGGPSITTQEDFGGGSVWDVPARTHRAGDGAALVALLDRLGLGPGGPAESSAARAAGPVLGAPVSDSAPDSAPGWAAGWFPVAAGVLLGAGLTILGLLFRRRVLPVRTEPSEDAETSDLESDFEMLDAGAEQL